MKPVKKITIDQAISIANKILEVDPKSLGRDAYQKSYIYKLICKGVFRRHGPPHIAQLEEEQWISFVEDRKSRKRVA